MFLNSTEGYALGVLRHRTVDGGATWTHIDNKGPYFWTHGQVVDGNKIYLAGEYFSSFGTLSGGHFSQNASVARMDSVGNYFAPVQVGQAPALDQYRPSILSLHFVSDSVGFVTLEDGTIHKTFDAGVSWKADTVSPNELHVVYFRGRTRGYAAGAGGRLYQTTDGGLTWAQHSVTGTTRTIRSLRFVDAGTGYAVGDSGLILATLDSGATWTPMASGTTANLNHIFLVEDGTSGYAVGARGTILKLTGGTPSSLQSASRAVMQGTQMRFRRTVLELPDGRRFELTGKRLPLP